MLRHVAVSSVVLGITAVLLQYYCVSADGVGNTTLDGFSPTPSVVRVCVQPCAPFVMQHVRAVSLSCVPGFARPIFPRGLVRAGAVSEVPRLQSLACPASTCYNCSHAFIYQ